MPTKPRSPSHAHRTDSKFEYHHWYKKYPSRGGGFPNPMALPEGCSPMGVVWGTELGLLQRDGRHDGALMHAPLQASQERGEVNSRQSKVKVFGTNPLPFQTNGSPISSLKVPGMEHLQLLKSISIHGFSSCLQGLWRIDMERKRKRKGGREGGREGEGEGKEGRNKERKERKKERKKEREEGRKKEGRKEEKGGREGGIKKEQKKERKREKEEGRKGREGGIKKEQKKERKKEVEGKEGRKEEGREE
ncbi:Zinc finger CCCH domain-containing protein 13, partial [Ophiophagus hannah]